MSTAIDFGRSSCTWLLKEQPSYGRFAVDAVLWVQPEEAQTQEAFVLCAQVFACDVYGDGKLFKNPPYGFSATFSDRDYRIFRDPVAGHGGCQDTVGRIAERFQTVNVHLARANCRSINAAELMQYRGAMDARLSARVEFPADAPDQRIALEFPVRHLNVNRDAQRFQVETGPLLFAEGGRGPTIERLRRAYVAFGRLDRAEFLLDSPRTGTAVAAWTSSTERDCRISLLAIDESKPHTG